MNRTERVARWLKWWFPEIEAAGRLTDALSDLDGLRLAIIDGDAEPVGYTEDEIKPCPFCGGRGQLHPPIGWETSGPFTVGCMSPFCMADMAKFPKAEDAIAAWNKRHEPSDRERLAVELAWGIIANAYGGDWDNAPLVWREAAERWRDNHWHPLLNESEVDDE